MSTNNLNQAQYPMQLATQNLSYLFNKPQNINLGQNYIDISIPNFEDRKERVTLNPHIWSDYKMMLIILAAIPLICMNIYNIQNPKDPILLSEVPHIVIKSLGSYFTNFYIRKQSQ